MGIVCPCSSNQRLTEQDTLVRPDPMPENLRMETWMKARAMMSSQYVMTVFTYYGDQRAVIQI